MEIISPHNLARDGSAVVLILLLLSASPLCAQSMNSVLPAKQPIAPYSIPVTVPVASAGSQRVMASSESLPIAIGDLVEVSVFDTPELSQKSRVDNAGQIELVIGAKLSIAGLNPTDAARAVEARLKNDNVLLHPRVTLTVLESTSQGVTVLGEVKNPGTYPLWGEQRVLDLISAAGGLTQYASNTAELTHKSSSTPITINLAGSMQGADVPQAVLRPGDRLVVPRVGTVYVLGDVGRPGGYLLQDSNQTTVLQALALAQGLNRTAKLRGSLIRNTSAGPQQHIL